MQVVVIAAHPDDEIIGTGVLLAGWKYPCLIVHITDGAPRSGDDARNAGCASAREYAALRRHELHSALEAAGITSASTVCLDCPDQQAAWRIADHAKFLARVFEQQDHPIVFTHPYEGGHPDHDATAAAVHAAVGLTGSRLELWEFASYHAGDDGNMACERFLTDDGVAEPCRSLTREQRQWKQTVLAEYRSQARVLCQFPLRYEPLRIAPVYDFSRPPHAGTLYYERFDWGVRGNTWRGLAARAFEELGIPCAC